MWIKRILLFLVLFQIFLVLSGPMVYLVCKFGDQSFCQGLQESYGPDMEAFSISLETAIFAGVFQGIVWIAATLVLLWALKRRKPWFLAVAFIYTIVFLIYSLRESVLSIDIISATVLTAEENQEK